jgi:hypothetical protein
MSQIELVVMERMYAEVVAGILDSVSLIGDRNLKSD